MDYLATDFLIDAECQTQFSSDLILLQPLQAGVELIV